MAHIKGVVLSSEAGRALILTPEGEYRSIKTDQLLEVGELFDLTSRPWWRYALAAAVILAITLGTMDYYTVKAYAQVSDAVELGINRWGRVVSSRALSEEGQQILQNIDLKNMKVEAAVEKITFQTGTDPDPGNAKEPKVFPPQAAGNRDAEFIEKVEENMNHGYYKAQEKKEDKLSNTNKGPNENSEKKPGQNKSLKE